MHARGQGSGKEPCGARRRRRGSCRCWLRLLVAEQETPAASAATAAPLLDSSFQRNLIFLYRFYEPLGSPGRVGQLCAGCDEAEVGQGGLAAPLVLQGNSARKACGRAGTRQRWQVLRQMSRCMGRAGRRAGRQGKGKGVIRAPISAPSANTSPSVPHLPWPGVPAAPRSESGTDGAAAGSQAGAKQRRMGR